MCLVRLYAREAGRLTESGTLEFFGVSVAQPDGSTWVEFNGPNKPLSGQVRLVPPRVASVSEITAIGQALSLNALNGEAGRFEWRMECPACP